MMPQFALGIIRFLHDLFTVIWVGGLAFMVLTVLPSANKALGKGPQTQALVAAITRRHRVWVYICIAGLFITGMMLGKTEQNFAGFMRFDNPYSVLTAVKHILTFAMVAIALFRSIYFGRKNIKLSPAKNRFGMILILFNFVFGITVLLLSGIMSSM